MTPAAGRSVTVLGATGSVGVATLDLIRHARSERADADAFPIAALTAHRNVDALAAAAREHRAGLAVIADEALYGDLKDALAGSDVEPAAGVEALNEAAARPADWVMAAIIGAAGLAPCLTAVRRGAAVALANKEALVCAGAVLTRAASDAGARLLPVDSEHNAIFQVLDPDRPDRVARLILTASGGPFRTADRAAMAAATPEAALKHPVWSMGAKISIDSATLMNKGLELIEASHLFAVEEERLDVVVHPQSIVHSMVEYVDGSVLAQLGAPDMTVPIASTLAWPDRMPTPAARLDLTAIGSLTFEAPDHERFPALNLAREALRAGPWACAAYNAANEVAVGAFLDRRIGFLDISAIVHDTLASDAGRAEASGIELDLSHVMAADAAARDTARALVAQRASQAP